MAARGAAAALLGLLTLGPPGCGYTFGSGLEAEGIRTVFLQVAANSTLRQRLEVDLSAALSRELPATAGLLPADRTVADAILEVEITDEREHSLVSGSRLNPVLEGAQEVSVRIRLTHRGTGRVVVDRDLGDRAEFRDPIGQDLETARAELVQELARKIALALEAGIRRI